MDCGAKSQTRLEGNEMNGRIGAGIAVAAALVAVLWLFMQVRVQRAMAQVEAERDAAEVARQQAEHKVIAEPKPPRWGYHVLSVAGNDDAVNQAIDKLTAEKWEYVGVVPPSAAVDGAFARLLFKRMNLGGERTREATAAPRWYSPYQAMPTSPNRESLEAKLDQILIRLDAMEKRQTSLEKFGRQPRTVSPLPK
jgi:hypothetical protein